MIVAMSHWWRTRAPRERLLIKVCAVLLFGVLAPMAAFQGANAFRREASAELARAEAAARLVEMSKPADGVTKLPSHDGTLGGLVIAAAQSEQLVAPAITPLGPERVRVVFAPSPSEAVFRWLSAVSQNGGVVAKSAIVRAGEGGLVQADFEVARAP